MNNNISVVATVARHTEKQAGINLLEKYLVIGEIFFAFLYILRLLIPWFYITTTDAQLKLSLIFYVFWMGFHVLRVGNGRVIWRALRSAQGIYLLFWVSILLINYLFKRGVDINRHAFYSLYVVGFFLAAKFYEQDKKRLFKWLLNYMIIILGLQSMYSIPFLYNNYWIARIMMHETSRAEQIVMASEGIGGYETYLMLAIALPLFLAISLATENKIGRILLLCNCMAMFVSVLLSTFTAASSLAMVGCTIIIGMYLGRNLQRMKFLEISVFLIMIISIGIVWGTRLIASKQVEYMYNKSMNILVGSLSMGIEEGDYTGRARQRGTTLEAWLERPIIGKGSNVTGPLGEREIGGHSSWLDMLATYGIIGCVGFFGVVVCIGLRIYQLRKISGAGLLRTGLLLAWVEYIIAGYGNNVLYMHQLDFTMFFIILGATESAQWLVPYTESFRAKMYIGKRRHFRPRSITRGGMRKPARTTQGGFY